MQGLAGAEEHSNMSDLKVIFLPYWPLNPYQSILIEQLKKLGIQFEDVDCGGNVSLLAVVTRSKPNVLHLHALYPFFIGPNTLKSVIKLTRSLYQLLNMRLMGVKIVWTAHDLKHHENGFPKLDRIFTNLVARLTHAIITHGETAKQEVTRALNLTNDDNIFVIPHGNYIDHYENKIDRVEARKTLGIPDTSFVLLFLGLIRPYKGVDELIDAFKQLHHDGAYLVIAGKVADEFGEQIKQKTVGHDDIKFIPGFVADDKIQVYMNACDAVVLPYRDILTSGSTVLAMSFSRACIAPNRGCIGDMLDDSGAFLYDPDVKEGLLQAMKRAAQKKADLLEMGEHNRQLAEQWSWNRVAKMTLEVYQGCLNK